MGGPDIGGELMIDDTHQTFQRPPPHLPRGVSSDSTAGSSIASTSQEQIKSKTTKRKSSTKTKQIKLEPELEAVPKKRVKVGARASIACATCRKRKIRCSGDWPACNWCTTRKQPCVYEGHPGENGGVVPGAKNSSPFGTFNLSNLDPLLPSTELILEALDPFFIHNYDSFPFLHRSTLTESIQAGTAPKELLLCILAFAARFCKSLRDLYPTSPNAASEHYANIASQVLFSSSPSYSPYGDDVVSLVRCQCYLILGLYEVTAGIENQGWLKLGIAMRLALILRLGSEDEDEGTSVRNRTDFFLSEVRRRTFWACFLLDRTLTDGKEKPCSLRAPLPTALRMPGNDVDFILQGKSLGARLEPNPPAWSVPFRFESLENEEPEADLYGHTLRASELWQKISTYIGSGGRNHDRRAPWLPESSFSVLQQEINTFAATLPASYHYNEQNLTAHVLIEQGRLYGMLHLLLTCSTLVLHRDYIPFLPTDHYEAANGPVDGEPIFESPIAPPLFWNSLLATAVTAASTISDLLTSLFQHGSQVTHPFAGYAALASGTVHCHIKHWPQLPPHSDSAAQYFDQDVEILNSLRNIYPIAASWCDGIAKLDLLYHNLVRGVIDGDPNKVRQSVIRLLRTVKEEEGTSPSREIILLGPPGLSTNDGEVEGAEGLLSMTGMGMHGLHGGAGGGGRGGGTIFDQVDLSSVNVVQGGMEGDYDSSHNGGNQLMNLDLETEYQLDDYVPLSNIDWSLFSLLGGEGALDSLWTG